VKRQHADVVIPEGMDDDLGLAKKRAKTACERCRRMKVRCLCANRQDSEQSPKDRQLVQNAVSYPVVDSEPFTTGALPYSAPNESALSPFGFDLDMLAGQPTHDVFDWVSESMITRVCIAHSSMLQSFGSLLDDSFDFLDFDEGFPSTFNSSAILPDDIQSAIAVVHRYSQSRSGAASPIQDSSPQTWFSEPPQADLYDSEVLDIFVGLAVAHLDGTFKLFANFAITDHTTTELYRAMAAVGGLFCRVSGSFKIAKALYHDARRLLLASVIHCSAQEVPDPARDVSFCMTVRCILGLNFIACH